jgi:hypothetical protein
MGVRAVRRGDDVSLRERPASAHRNRFLTDRYVHEAGYLAVNVSLLDLPLDMTDDEHLVQEPLELLARQLGLIDEVCHCRNRGFLFVEGFIRGSDELREADT